MFTECDVLRGVSSLFLQRKVYKKEFSSGPLLSCRRWLALASVSVEQLYNKEDSPP